MLGKKKLFNFDGEAPSEAPSSTIPPVEALPPVEEKPAPDTIPAPVDTYQPSPRRIAPPEN
jgi:hypothetical protein